MNAVHAKKQSALSEALGLRLQIDALYAEYAHVIDDDRLEEWPGLFVEDGRYRVTTRENYDQGHALSVVYCDGRGMMADRVAALRTANIYEPHVYCHLTSCTRILKSAADGIHANTNFSVIRTMQEGESTIFACGRSIDVIVPSEGRLLFKERLFVMDSRKVDTLLVVPI